MGGERIGIIDLGSNTFHLLIVDINGHNSFETVLKQREFVGLAEQGIAKLSEAAIQRGLKTIQSFKNVIDEYNVKKFKVTGTAALRSAANKNEFVGPAEKILDNKVDIIKGDREAELIFKGVSLLHPMDGNFIIMDIGGGSVEFILVAQGKNIWSQSHNIGVGVLFNQFHNENPISKPETAKLIGFLYSTLKELREKISGIKIDALIGASGSFEVVESMNGNSVSSTQISKVSLDDYWNVSSRIINSSFEERSKMGGLPSSRVKLIVVAMILIDVVIEIANPDEILISPYALKEGLLSELCV